MVNAKRFPSDVGMSQTFQSSRHFHRLSFGRRCVVITVMIACVMAGFLLWEQFMRTPIGDMASSWRTDGSNIHTRERTPTNEQIQYPVYRTVYESGIVPNIHVTAC